MKKFLISAVLFGVCGAFGAQAAQLSTPAPSPSLPPPREAAPADTFNLSVTPPLTVGYLSPTFGAVLLGLSPDDPARTTPVIGSTLTPADFAASYRTELYGSQIGVSAGYMNSSSLFLSAPTTGWNLGAQVGYAGFYFHAGISEAAQQRLTAQQQQQQQQQRLINDPSRGWLAGFGYQTGGLNLRLSYMAAQTPLSGDGDSRTWMLGGVYQLSARLRLNADAFTTRDAHPLNAATPPASGPAAAPQGTGARVGVQLRF